MVSFLMGPGLPTVWTVHIQTLDTDTEELVDKVLIWDCTEACILLARLPGSLGGASNSYSTKGEMLVEFEGDWSVTGADFTASFETRQERGMYPIYPPQQFAITDGPRNHQEDQDYTWILPRLNCTATLVFHAFDLEARFDFVHLFDCLDKGAYRLVASLTGSQPPRHVLLCGRASDAFPVHLRWPGFTAFLRLDDGC